MTNKNLSTHQNYPYRMQSQAKNNQIFQPQNEDKKGRMDFQSHEKGYSFRARQEESDAENKEE